MTLDWLRQLLGLPEGLHGHIEDTASTGLSPRSPPRAPPHRTGASSSAPSTRTRRSTKAARLLELELRKAPVDAAFRCAPTCSTSRDACAVVATVGTTSSTSVDPVAAIADRAAAAGAWLHVDAAYAGSAAVCPELRHHFAGGERADSLVVNPHKWLFTPMDCSAFFWPAARRPPRAPSASCPSTCGSTRTSST